VVALGLHQPLRTEEIPLFLLEMRKRLMAETYILDKCLSTFLGRPPRICRRFCAFELPLDLNTDTLMGGSQIQQYALQKLDDEGWNTEGRVTVVVAQRWIVLMTFVQEDILELSLGHHRKERLLEQVESVYPSFALKV
jgi:chromatin structure-remodeling complex subunit RSC3/30